MPRRGEEENSRRYQRGRKAFVLNQNVQGERTSPHWVGTAANFDMQDSFSDRRWMLADGQRCPRNMFSTRKECDCASAASL